MQLNKIATATAVALAVSAVSVSAATVNISSVIGTWSDVDPNNTVGLSGVGTSAIHWGTPATNAGQSGYSFTGLAPQANVSSPFDVGVFTHNNFPISASPTPSSISGATLNVSLAGDVDGTAFNLASTFRFGHDETPNTGGGCCDDIVTLLNASYGADTINIGGTEFVFNIDGFLHDGSILSMFATQEGSANSATLVGSFIERPAPIPLPAAGWMLIAGLGGLAAMRRQKDKAAA